METTIAAISTAMSASGIGIIRISGENAMDVISRIYRIKRREEKNKRSSDSYHSLWIYFMTITRWWMKWWFLLMKAPHSYTKEDTVEIDCHGGVYVMKRILETVIRHGATAGRTRWIYETGIFKWPDWSDTGRIRYWCYQRKKMNLHWKVHFPSCRGQFLWISGRSGQIYCMKLPL